MFKKYLIAIVAAICFCIGSSYAQQYQNGQQVDPSIIEDLLESILKDEESELDFSGLEERLNYYLKNPIDLNTASREDLADLPFLSDLQIQEILLHRTQSGAYISTYELQSISSLDEAGLRRLLPFVRVGEMKRGRRSSLKDADHDLILRYGRVLESQRGYLIEEDEGRSRYLGSPDRMLLRYRFRMDDKLQLAINAKKDPGEEFFIGSQRRGFDYYSGSLYFQNTGIMKKLVLGDYSLAFGQGLSIWNGYSFGKGAMVHNVARHGSGIRPHTSTNETQYLRGVASTLNFGSIELSPFVSYKSLDATLTSDSSGFSSLGSSGYHRTSAEIKNRESIDQLVYGANITYNSSQLKVGGTFVSANHNKPRIPNQQLYNYYSFVGKSLSNTSLYYQYTYKNIYFFGEGAMNIGYGLGLLSGMIVNLSDQLSLVTLYRNYQKDFHGFLNQSFSEGSNAINEKGLYTGLIWNPNRKMEWVAYADYFKFPWVKYRVDGPSEGFDMFTQFSYAPVRSNIFSFRYRYRSKQENLSGEDPVNLLANVIRHQARLQATYKISEGLDFRNRAEFVTYQKGYETQETGWVFYHDLIYKPMGSALSGNLRLAAFKTDSYNSKIYAFENNVLYAHSSIPYFNEGFRFYLNLRYRFGRKIDFWAKYATFFYKKNGVGSGLDYIDGRTKSDIRLQLRFQF